MEVTVTDTSAEMSKQSQESKKNCEKGVGSQLKTDENTIILDVSPLKTSQLTELNVSQKNSGKGKRKRASIYGNVLCADKESLATECRREMDNLFEYYKELSEHSLNLDESASSSNNSLIACLLEESNLSFSKLVEVIYEKLKGREGVTLAYVRSAVLSVGQRMMYGITNAEADVLEDESESFLWCWETRDMKLLPPNQRGDLSSRRVGRKKIHERISALSAALSVLAMPENHHNPKSVLNKTSTKLGKTLSVEEIRSLVEEKKRKNDTGMAEKAAKLKEKDSLHELQTEKLRTEKEIKRMQEESEKEAKRLEREEAECKKRLKKQQEENERERKRREREEAELKRQRSVKKQATIMERFLKTKKSNNNLDSADKQSSLGDPSLDLPGKANVVNDTTSLMDDAFSRQDILLVEDLRKMHVDGWHKFSRSNRSHHWGMRCKPKIELFKELKLHESSTSQDLLGKVATPIKDISMLKDFTSEPNVVKILDMDEKPIVNDNNIGITSRSVRLFRKKLLQFDKSNRPAYYGTWSKKSCVAGPREPFKQDPDLDYDVDSDEEWEEEEPGESLSDCDKDNDEERLEEENLKSEDEEESADGFFVPDGYLSENEGVQVGGKSDGIADESICSPGAQSEVECERVRATIQRQKYLLSLTEQALRKGHPLIVSNLMHEKSQTNMAEDIDGAYKIERMCLHALSMHPCAGVCIIDVSSDDCPENEAQDLSQSQNKNYNTPSRSIPVIPDSDLLEFVSSIQSNSQGINKVLESLQGKFPTTLKSQLRNKIKERSDYVDNRRQVKKEILDRLGLSTSPERVLKQKGIIATLFSKRCLPSDCQSICSTEASPQRQVHSGDGGSSG